MDMAQFYSEARKRIEPELSPRRNTIASDGKFGGFRVRKKSFAFVKPVIDVPVRTKEEKIVYEVEPLDPKYTNLL